ncbi:MAG: hypothetical protein DCC68_24635 [Planctomycetota bacterium]|nr:MAG: hypothetical protein DCC68_24635 [Planctomycetota bacterium]
MPRWTFFVALSLLSLATRLPAAEIVTITAENLDKGIAPAGKEADWILGDHVMRNDKIVAVFGNPIPTRNANMTVKNVGGCIIDLTERDRPNDQLSAYYPGGGGYVFGFGLAAATSRNATPSAESVAPAVAANVAASGEAVHLRVVAKPSDGGPRVEVAYHLVDGDDFMTVTTKYTNPHDKPIKVDLIDRVRADRTFTANIDAETNVAWWDDEWFGQAYGIVPVGAKVQYDPNAKTRDGKQQTAVVQYIVDGSANVDLAPGKSVEVTRRVFPANSLLAARGIAARMADKPLVPVAVTVVDDKGPVPGAFVTVSRGKNKPEKHAAGRSDKDGKLAFDLPKTDDGWRVNVERLGRRVREIPLDLMSTTSVTIKAELPPAGYVVANITDDRGGPIPCKVQFQGRLPAKPVSVDDKAPEVDFGPDSADTAVKNVYYSHNGKFRQELPPGDYDAVISYGPEYDAVFTSIKVERGEESPLAAKLVRVVDSKGWVSSDFHSHSTPSGDNTSSQFGRVQNLLCEHIEFAPCTEHNRISTYVPHLKQLGVEHLMATCSGMELTGSLLPVNHQNAFPLVERPHTQDGGGPVVDNANPVAQIERLALWDDKSEKLVQMNHPNLVQILGDRDTDGQPDAGFENMFGFVDVMEVHPPHEVFTPPATLEDARKSPNTITNWMQMLNLGYRIPGVVNTDAHYNFHGSGFLRNYIKSPTDDPAKIATMDMVRASERGQVVMTNGPFLEATLTTLQGEKKTAGSGEAISAPDSKAMLHVRVQCPNWFDVDRVQVFINGRPDKKLNFTRRENAKLFSREVVRFDHEIPLELESDAHVIVATIGEESQLGVVMGPDHGKDKPVAVTNPIFVDVDGDGFKANGDLLGLPIPHQKTITPRGHAHGHEHVGG